jgi:small subunit ribosomal protein S13
MNFTSFLNTPVSTGLTTFRVLVSLKGIGPSTADRICKALGVLPSTPFVKITQGQRKHIENWIYEQNDILFESSLKRKLMRDVRKLVQIKNYRGLRLQRGLPVRGQRTKTNAKTARRVRLVKGL